jgi:citrate lyase subunit beta/citryl-CoA lyase
MLTKARTLEADEVFIDLEDAVAPSEKTDATREQVGHAVVGGDWRAGTLVVRVNGVGTAWCNRDIEVVVAIAGFRLDAVMIPKVDDASHVQFVDHLLSQLEALYQLDRKIGIEAQIETARGIVNISEIASSSSRLETLIFGPGDYAASLGVPQLTVGMIEPDYPGDQWHYALSRIVTTARAFGLQAIDGPYAAIRDLEGFTASAQRARHLGFDGKWALHPDQIGVCNSVFTPTQDQFDRADEILRAYEQASRAEARGAAMLGDEMIDEASRKMAEQVTARGQAAGMHPSEGRS